MMTRRMFSTSILAGAAAVLLPSAARSQSSVKARNVVLVHGAYADASHVSLISKPKEIADLILLAAGKGA